MSNFTGSNGLIEYLSTRFRDRRALLLKDLLLKTSIPGQTLRVLDLGGRYYFWVRVGTQFLDEHRIEVTLLNLNEDEVGMPDNPHPAIRSIAGDACSVEFADGSFDVVVTNSVVEHLGTWSNMLLFAANVQRLGRAFYCQTPNFWFPIDPHHYRVPFFHFLPRPTRAWILRNFATATYRRATDLANSFHIVDGARLLNRIQMAVLFPTATLHAERTLGLFVKSWTAIGFSTGSSAADR